MENIEYIQWLTGEGHLAVPLALLQNLQSLNLPPEHLGYLVLALAAGQQQNKSADELAQDPWIKWSLSAGWAKWMLEGEDKKISFLPLWDRLFYIWEKQTTDAQGRKTVSCRMKGDFDFNKILKWLDQVRGTLSITFREKQTLQEFNLRYGWSTDFILIFLQLVFERGQTTLQTYQPIAKRVYENGIHTVEELISFMNELDWLQYKVLEVKKCVGQYGGVTRPQREMYLKWQNQWHFGHEIIIRAAEETVRTNSPSFKYIDRILENWFNKGVKNMEDALKAIEEHDRPKEQKHEQGSGRSTSTRAQKKRLNRADDRDWEKMLGID